MNIEQAQALEMICYYAKEHLKDNKTMSQSVDIAKDIIKKELKALDVIKELFDFDFALRFPNNQPMLMITNKKTKEYWELPISKETQDILKEVLL